MINGTELNEHYSLRSMPLYQFKGSLGKYSLRVIGVKLINCLGTGLFSIGLKKFKKITGDNLSNYFYKHYYILFRDW